MNPDGTVLGEDPTDYYYCAPSSAKPFSIFYVFVVELYTVMICHCCNFNWPPLPRGNKIKQLMDVWQFVGLLVRTQTAASSLTEEVNLHLISFSSSKVQVTRF